MLCNGFLMNIWQIEMERSPYSNTLLFNRNTKLSLSIGLLLLFPALVQGADSLYDQQILQARQGQYAPFLSYLQQYQLRHALTPSQVADWLQVALWAGQDDEVVKVWRRYQVYMPLPARGTAAAAQALRNQKQWQTSLTLWQQALSQAPGSDDYRIGYIKTLADARKDGEALSEARRLVAEQASVAHLQTLSYVYLRLGKSWDQLLVDTQILDRDPQNKTALADVGYWSPDMITEDIDISWKLQLRHWDIFFEPRALCWILMPETLKGLWKQRLRWAQGGAEVFLVNLRRLFHWQHHRMWPLFLEYACSTLWAFAYAITILLFILSRLMPLPDNLAVHSLFPPEFTGMLLGLMCLLQFVASLYIERRYEKKVAKSLFWVIWFPMVYWMIGLLTTLVAFPKVMVKRQRSRARWVSPDRGKGSL